MRNVEIHTGLHIHHVALTLVAMANEAGEPVGTDHNGVELVACPRDCPETVVRNWDNAFTALRLIHLNSPEGREKRRQALMEIIRKASAEIAAIDNGETLSWPED